MIKMLQIGMTVKVLPDAEYGGKYTGCVGVVKNYYSSKKKAGVELEKVQNDASSKGLFWFSEAHLQPITGPMDFFERRFKNNECYELSVQLPPSPYRGSPCEEGYLQRPQNYCAVGRWHQNHCFLWRWRYLRLLHRVLCRCGEEVVWFHYPRQKGFG